ncbi:MAG: hypothetical protein EOP83_20775 [Verrucomicrobiaceae bacterium]|nr:MAG: hypothetical protein EOP83_20775 [Verrucomicrobiaceae bacterium]
MGRLGDGPIFYIAEALGDHSAYHRGDYVGKSSSQIGIHDRKDREFFVSDSEVYEKWSQAIASAEELVWRGIGDHDLFGRENSLPFKSVVLPILVIPDGALWVLDYAVSGITVSPPVQAESCDFYVGRVLRRDTPRSRFSISHLHILTATGFRRFISRMARNPDAWDRFFPDDIACRRVDND